MNLREETRTEDPNRAAMMRFWAATESGDEETLVSLVHPDIVMEWPQSGERFTGVENALGALRAQEQKPEVAGELRTHLLRPCESRLRESMDEQDRLGVGRTGLLDVQLQAAAAGNRMGRHAAPPST